MPAALTLAALALLVAAATTDVLERRIPNAVTLALALVGLARLGLALGAGAPPLPIVADVVAAAAVFAVGAAGFNAGLVGGGDVKLLAAAALWLGAAALLPFLMATALAGGVLAALFLVRGFVRPGGGRVALPYGVAIAAGAVLTGGTGLWG